MRLPKFLQRKSSREVAKDRLKILLISDRVNCSPEVLDMIKKRHCRGHIPLHEDRHKKYGDSDKQGVQPQPGG